MSGFIQLHRKITEWEWYQNTNTKSLFLHCLFKANWKDKKWQGETIKRGSFITSLEHLSIETGLTIRQVRTALDKLIMTNELTKLSTNNYTIISITNYNTYQQNDTQDDKQMTNERQTNDKQMTTTNKDNKDNKDNKRGVVKKRPSRLNTFLEKEYGSQEIPKDWGDWAYQEKRLTEEEINQEWGMMYNWAISTSGSKATKLNWYATWQNWVNRFLKEKQRKEELNELYSRK